ncbi:MAG TPA: hypothetical protein VGR73_06185 [Bryobacteraceae bacterium]|nr:hypothetical protein [Bryobacteraceae bacterium]
MDGERKYKQRGYQESDRDFQGHDRPRGEGARPPGPRPPIDVTGPRLPRLVQAVTASRCYNCSTALPQDVDFRGNCPKCGAALHCCKQCTYFEPSTRFQCLKPVPVRIAQKDQANECALFKSRVTVARDAASAPPPSLGAPSSGTTANAPVRDSSDARAAFDNLFKKL